MDLVPFQLGMFQRRGQDNGPPLGVNRFGDLVAGFPFMAKQFEEHGFNIVVGVVVAIPEQDIVPWLAAGFPLNLLLAPWCYRCPARAFGPMVIGVMETAHRLFPWHSSGQIPESAVVQMGPPHYIGWPLPVETVGLAFPLVSYRYDFSLRFTPLCLAAMNDPLGYVRQHESRFEEELKELLRIPSISADSRHQEDVRRAAGWLVEHLRQIGLQAELIETPGHPIVYAESPPVPGAPIALVYGHYDVQPPDPLDQWITPPFEPTERDGNLYARGATDDKGQLFTHVKGVEAHLATTGKLPLQVKFVIEGEEEVGSEQLDNYLARAAEKLACDCVVISDTAQFAPGVPAITCGLRGIAYYELLLSGPNSDLHSGVFGGGVTNPANTLCRMLASLVDAEGRITLPEFYDDVEPLEEAERGAIADLPFDEGALLRQLGVDGLSGEAGYSTLERRWTRPSYDLHGLVSGYQGEGAKTVLPATAQAKFSFRLVPKQDPKKITAALRRYLEPRVPPGIRMELVEYHGGPGFVMSLESDTLHAAAAAIEMGFGRKPVFMREGGSIPIVNAFSKSLQADVLLLGWGQNDDNLHAPNEKFSLADFHRGIRASTALWEQLAKADSSSPS
jgi:acetylornithine deacetylase/succinyl-diaminopimelate desuccinylase-like protein